MPFADDQLYDGCIRNEMHVIVATVKASEIIPHLPCLTQSDREEIEAKLNTSGNRNAMMLLLECLRRRENWAEQFIRALELCEHWSLASKFSAKHESLRGPRTPVAHAVHTNPSRASNHSPSMRPVQAPLLAAEVGGPFPQPDAQSVAISGGQKLAPVNTEASGAAAPPQNPAAPSGRGLPGASSLVSASGDTSLPPSLPPASETPTSGPAVSPPEPQVSPVKPPVQDSNPPTANAVQQPVENSDPTVNQVAVNDQQAHPAQGSLAPHPSRLTRLTAGADHADGPAMPSLVGGTMGEDECLSKPGTLLSCNAAVPQPAEIARLLPPVPEEPYSGDSGRLQFSSSYQERSESTAPLHNEPVEDQYDSIHQSLLGNQDVRENVGHVSEDASLPNYSGQAPRASNLQPSLTPMQNFSPPGSEAEQTTTGPSPPGHQQSGPQRNQRVFPYNMLENYYVPAAIIVMIVGVSVGVMLVKHKN